MPDTSKPGYMSLSHVLVALLGVGSLALVAGINDEIGKVVVVFMVGIAIWWAMAHVTNVQGWFKKGGIAA